MSNQSAKSNQNLIWIDLEMTGLDPETDQIIEIATVITDGQLNILAKGPVYAISTPLEKLQAMDAWNTKQHTQSGLYDRVVNEGVDLKYAEEQTLAFIKQYVNKGVSPMAGNSICQDRRFLARYMPTLEAWFHYRNFDVSTIKEIHRRWYPEKSSFKKRSDHLALNDILDSIAEMAFYRAEIFISNDN